MKVIDNVIYINRGDEGRLPFKIPIKEQTDGKKFYQFKVGDVVTFGVYNKKGYDEPALILKKITIEKTTETCYIPLASDDTRFGELINKETEYWYEISLNKETVLGHRHRKDGGARILWLLPEGSDKQ